MNSRFAKNLVGVFLGIVIAFVLALKPVWGLGSIVFTGLLFIYIMQGTWNRRSSSHAELIGQACRQEIVPAQTYYKRGQARLAQLDYDGAIADFNRVIDIDNNFGAAYYYRALALIAMEEVVKAIMDLQVAADLARQHQEEQLHTEINGTLAALQQPNNRDLPWLQSTPADLN